MNNQMLLLHRQVWLPVVILLALTGSFAFATRQEAAQRVVAQEMESPTAAGDLDLSFAPSIIRPGFVQAVAVQTDGKVLLGGGFITVNGVARSGIVRLNADGTLDTSFGNALAGANDAVYAIAVQADGKVVIGGFFTTVNGVARGGIARLNTNGTLDTSFGNALAGANSDVRAVVVQADGKVLIGGSFTTVNGVARGRIARLNTDGTLDTSFGNALAGANNAVVAIAVQADGKVLIGGFFSTVNGGARGGIARLNADGTLDTSFGNALAGADGGVNAVAVQTDGKVILGGGFITVNGGARGGIARLNTDGTLDTSFGNALAGANDQVNTVAVQPDGKVVIGGFFTTVNGVARGRIARLNADGTLDTGFSNALVGANNTVVAIAVQADGKVILGGFFTTVNGGARGNIARLNADGTLDNSFGNAMVSLDGFVFAIAVQADNKVLLGGVFSTVNGGARGNIARLNADGTLDTSFGNALAGTDFIVYAIAVQTDGKVVIGGNFTTINGVARGGIARLNADGTLDTSFGNGLTGAPGLVFAVAVQADGKVVIGGSFTTVNGVARGNIARLNADGTLDTSFGNALAGTDSSVNAVAVQADGKVLIGGFFTTVNGVARGGIARLNTDGTLDTSFGNALAGTDSSVNAVAVQADGKVVIGGSFTTVNGVARGRIARLNADGTLDAAFGNTLPGANDQVNTVAVQPDGKVVIGGFFTTVNGVARGGIARLNTDGTLDTAFGNALAGTNSGVATIALQGNNKILLGGEFTTVNGTERRRLARLLLTTPGTLQFSTTNYPGNENSGTATITVTRTDNSGAASVNFVTAGGTATGGASCSAGVDYINTSGTLNWADGDATNKTFNITLCNDNIFEGNETAGLIITNATGAVLGSPATATLIILDDETQPTIAVNDVTQAEGSGLGNSASYTGPAVSIPDNNPAGVNIPLTVTGVGAVSDLNFRFDTAGACDALVGNTNAGVTHTWVGDLVFKLTSPAGTTVTFIDRIGFQSSGAGFDGNNFCAVTLSDDGGLPFIENVATEPVAGNFAPNNPFSAFDGQNANGTWTLNVSDNAGADTGTVNRFSLVFNSGNLAEGGPKQVRATVKSGPAAPSSLFAFNVTLSNPSSQTVTVNYATSNGTALAGSDYLATSGTVTFNPGEVSKPVAVTVIEDSSPEPDETFNLNLSAPVNATISDGLGVGTIANDDFALSISGRVVNAASQGVSNINVTLSGPVSLTVITNQDGNYAFTGLSANAAYAVIASSPFFTFTPPRADFPNLSANQTQNFTALNTPPAPVAPLTDDFSSPTRDATKWTQGILTQPPGSFDPNVIVTQGGGGAAQTFSYTGAAVAIPDNTAAGVNVTLPVSGFTGNIADLNFRFDGTASSADPASATVGVNHSFIGDLQFKLTSPAGTTVTFFNRVANNPNCASNNIFNLTLDDEAAANMTCPGDTNAGPLTGSFKPDAALTAFDGQNPNGTWTLNVADLANLDIGSLRRFSLVISSATGGQLRIQPVANQAGLRFGGYVAVNSLDLSNGQVSVELAQAGTGGAQSLFSVGTDFNNFNRFLVMSPQGNRPFKIEPVVNGVRQAPIEVTMPVLMFQIVQNGQIFLNIAIPYDPVAHRFLRFRHLARDANNNPANLLVFETSPDATVYTERARGDLGERSVASLTVELAGGTAGAAGNPGPIIFDNLMTQAVNARFALAAVTVSEGAGQVTLNVTRTGLTNLTGTMEYSTGDGTATQRTRYVAASGVLSFASGETSKSLTILLQDNALVDGSQDFNVFLGPGQGMGVNGPGRVIVTITDNDTPPITTNPLETPAFFVTQQYYDFLSRQPDQAGLDFWVGQIVNPCGGNAACISQRRVAVSNAFFFELEFQQTGSFVYRLYRAAYGNTQPFPNTMGDNNCTANPANCQLIRAAHVPSYAKFINDRARLDATQLAATQLALANAFVLRSEFRQRYPLTQSAAQFVDALIANIQAASGANLASQRDALIALHGTGGRGAVLFRLAEDNMPSNPINNRPFIDAEYNRSFVTTQYYGYLRRDADLPGLNFWLSVVNQFPLRSPVGQNGMVCAFITSAEYQTRFSAIVTRTNAECGP